MCGNDVFFNSFIFFVEFKTDEPLMNDLMLTLSALLVRTEFCKKVEEAGGLELIKDVMKDFHDNEVRFVITICMVTTLLFSFAETD